jgi:hypothetical protein
VPLPQAVQPTGVDVALQVDAVGYAALWLETLAG